VSTVDAPEHNEREPEIVGAWQVTHEPLLQTALLPQRLPSAPEFGPSSVQTGVPVLHEI
jgi:hypothetical protein